MQGAAAAARSVEFWRSDAFRQEDDLEGAIIRCILDTSYAHQEAAMATPHGRNAPLHLSLHPAIPRILVGCIVWLCAALWIAFAHDSYAALQIAVVVVFAAVFVGMPLVLNRLSKKGQAPGAAAETAPMSFREWLRGDFQMGDHAVPAREAAAMILLVPVACTIGLSVMAGLALMASLGAL
jgi:hypothetical protein